MLFGLMTGSFKMSATGFDYSQDRDVCDDGMVSKKVITRRKTMA